MKLIPFLASIALLALSPLAQAQVVGPPSRIDYQGTVLDSNGAPLAPTTPTNYTMRFRIYDQQTGGTRIWSEEQIVTVSNGMFSVRLGEGTGITNETSPPLTQAFNGSERFLGLTVVIPSQTPGEITPRLAFLSAPYAIVAARSRVADSVEQTTGASTLGQTTVTNLTVTAPAKINGANSLEFGGGIAGKQVDAGKIGYGIFSQGAALDIVGAGTSGANRRINFFAEGGTTFTGDVTTTARFIGSGVGLTNLNGANLANGSVDLNKLATGSVDMTKLVAAVQQALCPPGTIVAYGGTSAPPGWLMCDGTQYIRGSYPNLFAAIGTAFGADSIFVFKVPDFRGKFLRGRDGGAGYDPDRFARFGIPSGAASGDNVGSLQFDAFRAHSHTWRGSNGANSPANTDFTAGEFGAKNLDTATSLEGGNETRPVNIYVNYIIKF